MAASSLASTLLVAMPQLRDPNFRRAVVLVVHHDAEGTFGVVINRDTEISAVGLCASLELEWGGEPDAAIGWGGPVQPQTGWMVFESLPGYAEQDVEEVGEGICFAGSMQALRHAAGEPPEKFRLLVGYAGWGPGQLEMELAEGAWLIAPASEEVIFRVDPALMWDHVLREMGVEPATLVVGRGVH